MLTTRFQRTIVRPAVVRGFGYWTGRDVTVEFHPSGADTGVVFVRTDLTPARRIPALVTHRVETPRRTSLRAGPAGVEMVEHVMAALVGLRIDNCEVRVDAAEMPGLDGSAQAFVEALTEAGAVEQPAPRPVLIVRETVRLGDERSWVEARPSAGPGMAVRFCLDYGPGSAIGKQTIGLPITPESFRRELASCRTFMLQSEAEWLLSQGLGTRVTNRDLLIFGPDGPIENELRFRDECARHKALDLVGDLALSGFDLQGHFIAFRSGHRLNAELVRALLSEGEIVGLRRRRSA